MTVLTFEKRESSTRVQKWMNDPATLHKPLLFDPFCLENKMPPPPPKKKWGNGLSHKKRSIAQNCSVNWLCKSTLFDVKCHPKCRAADKWATRGKVAPANQVAEGRLNTPPTLCSFFFSAFSIIKAVSPLTLSNYYSPLSASIWFLDQCSRAGTEKTTHRCSASSFSPLSSCEKGSPLDILLSH